MTEPESSGPAPYQEPAHYQQPPPYQVVSDDQRRIRETKGRRGIGFGAVWLVAGILITAVTYSDAARGGVYFVAWGPVVYGIYRIVAGYRLLAKSRR
ncbi:hypothetical protein [Amycolatopsis sp.]|uniref:hypothetical protein n=1 Tax=Amycolatopsis sp. TaxID=37632 RepID=UPI002B669267|nr:hypothetical protein [Amycolatopsis sp.]HVV14709.1 hypothetical protein [Amycolatopsis sp.]